MKFARRFLALLSIMALAIGISFAQNAMLQTLDDLEAAMNAGDAEAFAAKFTDAAEVTLFGPEVARFPGRAAIQGWATYLASVDAHLTLWQCAAAAPSATCRFAVASDETDRLDLGPLEGTVVARFEGEQMSSLTIRFTPEDLAVYASALESAYMDLYRGLVEDVLNGKNLGALDRYTGEDFVNHGALPGQPQGREGLRQMLAEFFDAFPDLQLEIDHLVADGSIVVAHGTATGTHEGQFFGIPPTGETVTWEYFDMGRVQNGVFVERWGLDDTTAILQQLGVMDAPSDGN